MMRLDKFLSEAGVASRKELKAMIRQGRVKVDGAAVKSPELKIDEISQKITVDNAPVTLLGQVVVMMHKPKGYVTSTADPRDRVVMELLPEDYRKMDLFPVGRLDKDTEGLLLFTNDGELGHLLTSPKHQVEKEYYAETEGTPDEEDVLAFRQGITLRDGTECLPAELYLLDKGVLVVVREGKYHQVRRMLASRGKPVTYLKRIREGKLTLGDLPLGECRLLKEEEVALLL